MPEKSDVHDHSRVLAILDEVLSTPKSWPKLATEFMRNGSVKAALESQLGWLNGMALVTIVRRIASGYMRH
jgi:hypothetical protein